MENYDQLKKQIQRNGLTYHVVTYGCQMNEHESEKLCGLLEDLGYLPAACNEDADFIIFNTCCVRDNAEQKTFGNVGAVKKLKEENPRLMVAVCGCMTQQPAVAQKMSRTFPFVDIIFGTHNIHRLPAMIAERLGVGKRILEVQETDGDIIENVPVKRHTGPLASVNIMYGCNNFCSYCIVPFVRGRERSRNAEDIVCEVSALAAEGYQEVMLLGQNVNSYDGGNTVRFPTLLQMICRQTPIRRIRFMTSHPKDLSDDLIAVIADNPQICKHIHLPVQSGSTRILQEMNRKYSREQYLTLVDKIRAVMPDIVLTTDIIVGFPGETERDFEDTLDLVENVQFDSAFTFVYSPRTGTKAASLPNPIPPELQRERIMRLIELQNGITEQCNKRYEGRVEHVLVEGISTRSAEDVCGRTDGGKMVNFRGVADQIGSFCDVRITKAKRTTLFGELQ